MDAVQTSPRATSPLPAIIVSSAVLGVLALLLTLLSGGVKSATFLQFGAVLAALVYFITLTNLRLGLAILIVCVAFSPKNTVGGMDNVRLEDFLFPGLLLAWLVASLRSRQELVPMQIKAPFLAFLAVNVISGFLGLAFTTTTWNKVLPLLGKNIEYFILFLLILNNIRTYTDFKAFVIFSLIVSAAASLLTGGEAMAQSAGEGSPRVSGPTGEGANIFGGYIILHLSILIGLFFQAATVRGRVAAAVGFTLLLYALFFTYSRTSYAALALAVTIFALLKHRKLLFIVMVALVLFPLLAPHGVLQRAATITTVVTDEGPASWQSRVGAWQDALDRFYASPLFGNGLGSIAFGDVDNEYFRVLVDMGVLGIAALFWLLLQIGWKTNKTYDAVPNPGFMKGYLAGYFIAFLAIMIHCSGATTLSSIRTMETFMILTGFAMALAAHREEWQKEEESELKEHAHYRGEAAMIRRKSPAA